MTTLPLYEWRVHAGTMWDQVGSRVTCDPPPTDTDEDWVCLYYDDLESILSKSGYTIEGNPEKYDSSDFISYRNGEVNVIVIEDDDLYYRFLTATSLAKRFNLLDKKDRIDLFQAVLYGNGEGHPF